MVRFHPFRRIKLVSGEAPVLIPQAVGVTPNTRRLRQNPREIREIHS